VFWRLSAALCCERGGNDRLVRVHVGDGRDADARRLDDVDGVDADARTDVARRRGVVPWHVDRNDGGDDAAVLGPNAVAGETRLGRLTALVGVGYFFVWTVFGMAAFPLGVALATVGRTLPADAGPAWRHGLRLGLHCSHCCAGLMAILLVIGVMDFRAMAVVAAAITVELELPRFRGG
jgi:Predicted metal-binding integral membrane protein (DUF2182)